MEDSINWIDNSKDENLITIRNCVDKVLVFYDMSYTMIERNNFIITVFKLIQKKYIAPEIANFEKNKNVIIYTIVKSYLGSIKIGKPNLH